MLKKWDEIFADNVHLDLQAVTGQPPTTIKKEDLIKILSLSPFDASSHIITNHVIVLNGNTAEVTSQAQTTLYLELAYEKDDWINRGLHGLEYQVCFGRFHFGFILTNGHWKFNKVKFDLGARYGNKDILEVAFKRAKKKIDANK